jgi:hypothetical protein
MNDNGNIGGLDPRNDGRLCDRSALTDLSVGGVMSRALATVDMCEMQVPKRGRQADPKRDRQADQQTD